jgi:hypothetical protein
MTEFAIAASTTLERLLIIVDKLLQLAHEISIVAFEVKLPNRNVIRIFPAYSCLRPHRIRITP